MSVTKLAHTTQSQWTLTSRAGSSIWFIRTGTHKAIGLSKAEVSAAAIIDPTEVGTLMRGEGAFTGGTKQSELFVQIFSLAPLVSGDNHSHIYIWVHQVKTL